MSWNFGDILDALTDTVSPENPALIHGTKTITWSEFDRRSNNLARALLERGAKTGDKVAFYMRNQPAYIETLAACFKARLTHVNVNYRYRENELHYIIDNSDAQAVIFDTEFREQINAIRDRLPNVGTWLELNSDSSRSDYVTNFEDLASAGSGQRLDVQRSPDDLLFLYTGGTTGMPKGVMWPHGTLRAAQIDGARAMGPVAETLEQHLDNVREVGIHGRQIPACPLMHGTGLFTALAVMINGGAIITLESKGGFDPIDLWQKVDQHGVTAMAIVGDAFAKPMLQVLQDNPGKFDVSSVQSITSSGVMWSSDVKQGLLKHMPQAMMIDSFGASEAVGFGTSITTAGGEVRTSKFTIGEHCKVFTEDGREVERGSSEPGFIARGGNIPLGYYKDEKKTAETFRTINGARYSIPGDWCTVEEDGTLTLLGRGSVCINTGGEKVYPEEIEEVLKEHPNVDDALVVGLPDEKWGQAVTAVVSLENKGDFNEDNLKAHVRDNLAPYKTPKRILAKENLGRAPNGKADYKAITSFAKDAIASGL